MKSSKSKNSTGINTPASKPFFSKNGEGSFFSQTSEIGDSFFNPVNIQPKPIFDSEENSEGTGDVIQKKALPLPIIQRQEEDQTSFTPLGSALETSHNNDLETGRLIVNDRDAPGSEQMTKTAFLNQLNREVCQAAEEALSGTPFSASTCPYIRRAFARHRNSSPRHIEQVLQRYEPRAINSSSANELINIIRNRTFQAVNHWKGTGDLSRVPPEIAGQIPASISAMARTMGAIDNIGSSVVDGISSIGSSIVGGVSDMASSIGSLFFKGKSGGAQTSQSPAAVMDSLGSGQAMQGGTRSKMENAFGSDFGEVRIHSDSNAANISEGMNAKAFTVGNHIAFNSGLYKPDNPVGDALLAHELAHVEQQKGATEVQQKSNFSNSDYNAMEEEADLAAAQVIEQTYGGKEQSGKLSGKGRKSLTIQKCGGSSSSSTPVRTITAASGNTEIITRITGLIGSRVNSQDTTEVMNALNTISTTSENRLRLIIMNLERSGHYNNFLTNLANPVAATYPALMTRITALHTEFTNPTAGTTATTAANDAQIKTILNTGMNVTGTGEIAAFIDVIGGRSFDQDCQETLDNEVAAMTPESQANDVRPRFGWPRYQEIANEAKHRTDQLYGHYRTGSVLASSGPGRNLFDIRDQTYSDADLRHFANYLITGHGAWDPVYPGTTILSRHNFAMVRPPVGGGAPAPSPESAILNTAITTWMATGTNRAKLALINRNWGGMQGGGNIYTQRWDMGNVADNRRQFWSMFHTMIHEYLHKVTHPHYSDKAETKGRRIEQIYTEGGTSYFDRNVWNTLVPAEVASNAQLREKVEGAVYPYDASLIPGWHGYQPQTTRFEEIVAEVGEDNARAAYFNGLTDRIGLGP